MIARQLHGVLLPIPPCDVTPSSKGWGVGAVIAVGLAAFAVGTALTSVVTMKLMQSETRRVSELTSSLIRAR